MGEKYQLSAHYQRYVKFLAVLKKKDSSVKELVRIKEIARLYVEEHLRLSQIAERYGVDPGTLQAWISVPIDIEAPEEEEEVILRTRRATGLVRGKDIIKLYIVDHLTTQQIGDLYGVQRQNVWHWLQILKVKTSDGEWVKLTCIQCKKDYQKPRCVALKKKMRNFCSMECYNQARHNPVYKQ